MYYTNLQGEKVELTDRHIETSVSIYEELRKLSPSGKVNWKQHKSMMEQEGFYDSEISERYRVLIREERRKRNILPTISQVISDSVSSKLDSVKNLIGEMRLNKLEVQKEARELNKLKRELSLQLELVEQISKTISDVDFSVYEKPYTPVSQGDKKAIVVLTDIHFGCYVDNEFSVYNPEIASDLLDSYCNKLIDEAKLLGIKEYYVINLGDIIEGDLRPQSLVDSDMTTVEQTVRVSQLIIEFLSKLSQHVKVLYSGIAGNHDRLNKNIKEAIEGNSAQFVANHLIQSAFSGNKNVTYMPLESLYYGLIEYGGYNILAVHGDRTSVMNNNVLAEQSVLHGKSIDIIIAGHFHHFVMKELSNNKYVVVFGSLKGIDDYSIKIGSTSCRSQGIVVFDEDNFQIKQIKL